MSDEQRREELIMGLSATGEEACFVNVSHLAQAVGMEKMGDLVESLVETHEVVNPNLSPRSTLRTRNVRNGVAQVNRNDVLEACLKAKADSSKKAIDKSNAKLPVPKT